MKILIVEDNERVRELIKRVVAEICDEVYECSDGAEALAAYDVGQPDWVLMDIEMKNLDGLSASHRIKAAHPGARIVIVTRHDDTDLRKAAHDAGACEYVLKDNLLELKRLLESSKL
jgi:CheY-like chemotaxis protein